MNRIDRSGEVARKLLAAALESGVLAKQAEAASVLGVSEATVSRMVHGGLEVTPDRLAMLLGYIGIDGVLRASAYAERVDLPQPREVPAVKVVPLATAAGIESAEAVAAAVAAGVDVSDSAIRRAKREVREAIAAQMKLLDGLDALDDDSDDEPTTIGPRAVRGGR